MKKRYTVVLINEGGEIVVGTYPSLIAAVRVVINAIDDHIWTNYRKDGENIYEVWPHEGEEKLKYVIR